MQNSDKNACQALSPIIDGGGRNVTKDGRVVEKG
jgi:hypothetical protein